MHLAPAVAVASVVASVVLAAPASPPASPPAGSAAATAATARADPPPVSVRAVTGTTARVGGNPSHGQVTTSWQSPVRPFRVTRSFDLPPHDWLPGHRGIDLATSPGAAVMAAGAGRVSHVGLLAGRGVVVVDHGALRTTYEPVSATVLVGQDVDAGEVIGNVAPGTGHCGDGSCLHLGLRRGSEYLDPWLVLGDRTALLIPW